MDGTPYSNRELDSKFNEVKSLVSTNHNETIEVLESIETQTIKTNGRVNILEQELVKQKEQYSFIRGGLAVITVLIIPVLLFIIYEYIKTK